MKLTLLWFALTLNAACYAADESTVPFQSKSSYEAAMRTGLSTSPSYVLITVVDANSGETRTGCTTANLLLGAIHKEYEGAFDIEGSAKAELIAQSNLSHTFRLAKPDALANVPFRFSQDDWAIVREKLQGLTIQELREGFTRSGKLHSIYDVGPWPRHQAYRDATACVLIERGLSPRMADITGQLWLAP